VLDFAAESAVVPTSGPCLIRAPVKSYLRDDSSGRSRAARPEASPRSELGPDPLGVLVRSRIRATGESERKTRGMAGSARWRTVVSSNATRGRYTAKRHPYTAVHRRSLGIFVDREGEEERRHRRRFGVREPLSLPDRLELVRIAYAKSVVADEYAGPFRRPLFRPRRPRRG